MKEIDYQSKVVDAIRSMGGFAQKASNRFLIGVPDILCQLPGYSTSFWEIKKSPHPRWQAPDLTISQKRWLRDFTRAGGFGGVIYFCKNENDDIVAIRPARVFNIEDLKAHWRVDESHYVVLPRGCKMQPFKDLLDRVHNTEAFRQRKEEYGY